MRTVSGTFAKDAIINALGIIFESIAIDLNRKPNGTINARPDIQRQWNNPKAENGEWFTHTLPEKYEKLATNARIGWRNGIFPYPGRTIIEPDPHQSQNVSASCASTAGTASK